MGKVNTSHYDIMMYWKDRQIKRDGTIINHSFPINDAIDVVTDKGEPECWACGKPIISGYEGIEQGDEDVTFLLRKIWSDKNVKSKLHRCHIVPAALGGEDVPSNLFLMCPNCHFLSPDTRNVSAFMRWVYKKRENSIMGCDLPRKILEEVDVELTERGLPTMKTIEAVRPDLDFSDWQEYLKKDIGTHGPSISRSSFVIGFADMIEEKLCCEA